MSCFIYVSAQACRPPLACHPGACPEPVRQSTSACIYCRWWRQGPRSPGTLRAATAKSTKSTNGPRLIVRPSPQPPAPSHRSVTLIIAEAHIQSRGEQLRMPSSTLDPLLEPFLGNCTHHQETSLILSTANSTVIDCIRLNGAAGPYLGRPAAYTALVLLSSHLFCCPPRLQPDAFCPLLEFKPHVEARQLLHPAFDCSSCGSLTIHPAA